MLNKNLLHSLFNVCLLFSFFISPTFIQAQPSQKTKHDSITMSHFENVTRIRSDIDKLCIDRETMNKNINNMQSSIDSLTNIIYDYTQENKSNTFSIISIIVMIVVFVITTCVTKKQIKSQHKDTVTQINTQKKLTEKHIKEQHIDTAKQIREQRLLSNNQIASIQNQSEERLNSLEKMGNKIKGYTEKIQTSVEHFEAVYVGKDDKKRAEECLLNVNKTYESVSQKLESDYDYFVSYSENGLDYSNYYIEKYTETKKYIEQINYIVIYHKLNIQLPSEESYLDAFKTIAFNPELDKMPEQIESFISVGRKYCEEITSAVQNIII